MEKQHANAQDDSGSQGWGQRRKAGREADSFFLWDYINLVVRLSQYDQSISPILSLLLGGSTCQPIASFPRLDRQASLVHQHTFPYAIFFF